MVGFTFAIWRACGPTTSRQIVKMLSVASYKPMEVEMNRFWQDLRYAARVLGKNPGVTAVMALTLPPARGGGTPVFFVGDGVFFWTLPHLRPGGIIGVSRVEFIGTASRL